jgi:aryl-alcohol dehydrogenase-like predicted oxidoreductase
MARGTLEGVEQPVSRLILGCGPLRPDRMEQAEALLDAFFAAGGTAVDTAHVYGDGASERALGRWLASRSIRQRAVVITKGAHPDGAWRPRLSAAVVARELAESLERLGSGHVDLYLLHRDDPAVPVGAVVEFMHAHVASGAIRAWGGSNWRPERLEAAIAYARAHGLRGPVASSPFLALAIARDPAHMGHAIVNGDAPARAWYRRTGFPLLAWSSQAQGFFSERGEGDAATVQRRFARYDQPDNHERRRRVRALASRLGCTPTQVALAWVLAQGNVYAIVGPGSVEHLQESLGALELRLTPEDQAWINLEAEGGGVPT